MRIISDSMSHMSPVVIWQSLSEHICVISLIHMCDMTHSYVWHDSFTCVTWLILIGYQNQSCHTCEWNGHTCEWVCVTWLILIEKSKLAGRGSHVARLADCRAPEFPFLLFSATPVLFSSATQRKQHRCRRYTIQGNFRSHDSSVSSSPSPLLSSPFPFVFLILFTKTAPVSVLHRYQDNFRFHDSSLSPSPSPILSPPLPFFFLFFSATLRNQRRCRRYADVTAILDFTSIIFVVRIVKIIGACTNSSCLLKREDAWFLPCMLRHGAHDSCLSSRGGGLGSRPKNVYGETSGDGVEYHLMTPTPRR